MTLHLSPMPPIGTRRCDGCAHWERAKSASADGAPNVWGFCYGVPPLAEPHPDAAAFPQTMEHQRCPLWTLREAEQAEAPHIQVQMTGQQISLSEAWAMVEGRLRRKPGPREADTILGDAGEVAIVDEPAAEGGLLGPGGPSAPSQGEAAQPAPEAPSDQVSKRILVITRRVEFGKRTFPNAMVVSPLTPLAGHRFDIILVGADVRAAYPRLSQMQVELTEGWLAEELATKLAPGGIIEYGLLLID